jgi:transketolase
MSSSEIKSLAKKIRKNILFSAFSAGAKSAHIGGALSIADIVATLYGDVMNVDSKKPLNPERDRFILSKGHACLALYSALVELNFFSREELKNFEKSGSFLLGHPVMNKEKGIEFSTGSLGMGLALGMGVAFSGKKRKQKYNTYVVLGDGECNEGSVWESFLSAPHLKLNNLTAIIDKNNLQQTGSNKDILNLGNLTSKLNSFGWQTYEVDGHNVDELLKVFKQKNESDKPIMVIANTIKGKGLSFTENNNQWHHSILAKKNYDLALAELDKE